MMKSETLAEVGYSAFYLEGLCHDETEYQGVATDGENQSTWAKFRKAATTFFSRKNQLNNLHNVGTEGDIKDMGAGFRDMYHTFTFTGNRDCEGGATSVSSTFRQHGAGYPRDQSLVSSIGLNRAWEPSNRIFRGSGDKGITGGASTEATHGAAFWGRTLAELPRTEMRRPRSTSYDPAILVVDLVRDSADQENNPSVHPGLKPSILRKDGVACGKPTEDDSTPVEGTAGSTHSALSGLEGKGEASAGLLSSSDLESTMVTKVWMDHRGQDGEVEAGAKGAGGEGGVALGNAETQRSARRFRARIVMTHFRGKDGRTRTDIPAQFATNAPRPLRSHRRSKMPAGGGAAARRVSCAQSLCSARDQGGNGVSQAQAKEKERFQADNPDDVEARMRWPGAGMRVPASSRASWIIYWSVAGLMSNTHVPRPKTVRPPVRNRAAQQLSYVPPEAQRETAQRRGAVSADNDVDADPARPGAASPCPRERGKCAAEVGDLDRDAYNGPQAIELMSACGCTAVFSERRGRGREGGCLNIVFVNGDVPRGAAEGCATDGGCAHRRRSRGGCARAAQVIFTTRRPGADGALWKGSGDDAARTTRAMNSPRRSGSCRMSTWGVDTEWPGFEREDLSVDGRNWVGRLHTWCRFYRALRNDRHMSDPALGFLAVGDVPYFLTNGVVRGGMIVWFILNSTDCWEAMCPGPIPQTLRLPISLKTYCYPGPMCGAARVALPSVPSSSSSEALKKPFDMESQQGASSLRMVPVSSFAEGPQAGCRRRREASASASRKRKAVYGTLMRFD
ncbi:hypothetical protein C8R47DRAFT_1200312 [Mycena vitilis]|nr:hypothetical protein C8R47DRAFT_1200312 [Mycena vitilis]